MLHYETVSEDLLDVLNPLMKEERLRDFRLVGGTALALQLGHRMSVDIDLFTDKSFDRQNIKEWLTQQMSATIVLDRPNGMQVSINDVKVDIYNWSVPYIEEAVVADSLRLASLKDIAAFKLDAITTRKEKKDYYDLYALIERLPFREMMAAYKQKYPYNSDKNAITALTSSSAADTGEQPHLLIPVGWEQVKTRLDKAVSDYQDEIVSQLRDQEQHRQKEIQKLIKQKRNRKI